MRFLPNLTVAALVLTACAQQASSSTPEADVLEEDGNDLLLCAECPPFVKVPEAPTHLRRIRYVAKFELTWNNYLASYDEGVCQLPNPNTEPRTPGPNDIIQYLDKYRIDWPIVKLGKPEIACYIDWLQRKTDLTVSLPSSDEWEWFARAGREGSRFPWGDEPDPSREALGRSEIPLSFRTPWRFDDGGREINHNLSGVKTGLFPPNGWGLYDVMGNVSELTTNTVPGYGSAGREVSPEVKRILELPRAVVKGSNWWTDRDWYLSGIEGEKYPIIFGDRYSDDVGMRLVMVEEERAR